MKLSAKKSLNLLDLSITSIFILIAIGVILNHPGLGFALNNNPPYPPSNPVPGNGATDVPVIGTNLDWDGGDPDPGDNVTYDVFFGRNTPPPLVAANITESNYTLGELNFTTNYYWQIKAWDSYNNTTQGPLWNFQTEINNPPNMPNSPNPIDGATGVPILNTILSWLGGDPDEGDTVRYDLYFGNHASPSLLAGNLTTTSYALPELNQTTTYYWRINATDNHGNWTAGPEWDFVTEINNPPTMPSPVYPEDGATGIPIIDTILSWLGGDPDQGDTVTYDVYFGNYTSPPLVAGNITETNYALPELNQTTAYYWKIKAWDNHGNFTQGPEWDFMTETPNDPPIADNQAVAAFIDTPANITLTAQDPDPLTYEITRDPYYGSLSGTPPDVIYTPNSGFKGKDSFTFKAYDGQYYSNEATVTIYVWTQTERLDPDMTGTQPTLKYAPNGDLRVFYNIGEDTNNYMVIRKRLNGESVFGSGIFVYDRAKTVDIHYDVSGKLDLAVDRGDYAVVLESLDNGDTWNFVKQYIGIGGGSATVTPIGFTEDGSNLRLFYNFMDWSGVFGDQLEINYAQRVNGNWISNGSYFAPGEISSTYENGDKVTLFKTGGLHHSTDNGVTFTYTRGSSMLDYLDASDVKVGAANRLYFIRGFTYGPEPNDQLIYRYSDDDGTNWSGNNFIFQNSNHSFAQPHFAIDGNKWVVVWLDAEPPPPDYDYRLIRCSVSEDGGSTWSPAMTLADLDGTLRFGVAAGSGAYDWFNGCLDVEVYNGKFTVAYSILGGTGWTRDGVYITELDLSNTNIPPTLNPIGNKGVYAGYNLQFNVSSTDPDPGDYLTLTATPLPQGADFVDHGDGTGTFSWTPASDQLGDHLIRFEVSDSQATDYEDIVINVSQRAGGPPCFLSHTPILMADGSSKPIEKVKVGDVILSYDVERAKIVKDTVKEVFVHDADSYLVINNKLRVTPDHLVFSSGKWVQIGTLKVGDKLLNHKGKYQKIKSIKKVEAKEKVYNFHVNPYHTYIANGFVVHNRKQLLMQWVGD